MCCKGLHSSSKKDAGGALQAPTALWGNGGVQVNQGTALGSARDTPT